MSSMGTWPDVRQSAGPVCQWKAGKCNSECRQLKELQKQGRAKRGSRGLHGDVPSAAQQPRGSSKRFGDQGTGDHRLGDRRRRSAATKQPPPKRGFLGVVNGENQKGTNLKGSNGSGQRGGYIADGTGGDWLLAVVGLRTRPAAPGGLPHGAML
eukprot:GGOE01026121.1.p2 GENE.GGOE01026121.1~~GGOE01026121.1.p2  ORF type:complete len:154 (+),score=4.81 GGOE01026121.1:800-1261(+)